MRISELNGKLPQELIESAQHRGIIELTPPQESAVRLGLFSGGNFIVSAPTASGKTFIAEMSIIRNVMWEGRKAVYIAPMRALVNERYGELKEAYPYLKIAISIGDLDSLDPWLGRYDVIFASTEKFDSLIRHGVSWLDSVGCVIFDEVHMLNEYGRGPTLEILMTRIRKVCKDAQIIALSATIGNAKELKEWLGAELIESDYRPVPLEKGVELDGKVIFKNRREVLMGTSRLPELRITEDTLERKKQLILFYSTKRNAEAGAEKLAPITSMNLGVEERNSLAGISEKVLNVLDKPTAQCMKLSRLVLSGVAFHHSGLVNEQRNMIEEAFRNNRIKAICATTTLGYGVNLPAHTVVVRDNTRYSGPEGIVRISVNEVMQLFGRAGRPRYDRYGRALLVAKSEEESKNLYKRYINAVPEPITSKLGVMPVLRTHILAFIASGFLTRNDSILGFLRETLYGNQYGNGRELGRLVEGVLETLAAWEFIEGDGGAYSATRIGRRVSELYIDPNSAKWIIDSLRRVDDNISHLFMIANTLEMRPYSRTTEEAEERLQQYLYMISGSVEYEDSYYEPEKPLSTAFMLNEWINEVEEEKILSKYGETPGSIFTKISNADWLLYSSMELAKLLRMKRTKLLELRVRVRYGIRKELLELVSLQQIGRVRARILYNNGIETIDDLRKEGAKARVERLLGNDVAKIIYDQVSLIK